LEKNFHSFAAPQLQLLQGPKCDIASIPSMFYTSQLTLKPKHH